MKPSRLPVRTFAFVVMFTIAWHLPQWPLGAGLASQALAQSRPRDQPQNIFEVLFPDLYKQRLSRERAVLSNPQNAAPIEKIEAPKYFTYKADLLAPVKLAALAKVAPQAPQQPTAQTGQPQGEELIVSVSNVLSGNGSAVSGARPGSGFARILPRLENLSVLAEPDIGKAMVEHYGANRSLLWLDDNLTPNLKAHAAMLVLEDAGRYGLDPEDYLVALPQPGASEAETLDGAARFEFMLTARTMRYALDASGGRVVPNRLSGYHDFPGRSLDAAKALSQIAADYPARALPAFHPANAPYKALLAELEQLKAQSDDVIALPEDLLIKPGQSHASLPGVIEAIGKRASAQLLAKHAAVFNPPAVRPAPAPAPLPASDEPLVTTLAAADTEIVETRPLPALEPTLDTAQASPLAGTAAGVLSQARPRLQAIPQVSALPLVSPELYSEDKVELVKDFQKEAGLGADGVIGRNTVIKLTGTSVASKRERVIVALEQLRWHPRDLGSRHVFINQPAFRARYVEGGVTRIEMRVVVGTKANQTSFFHDLVETVEYNPYWGVPQSILVNEFLPKLRQNPAYLDERGYEVTDAKGNRIASSAINWYSFGASIPYDVRQSPGEANALGELKILFPNKHAIYMHDTPARELFKKDFRAFSHGCVRLAEPRLMAAAVLGTDVGHIEAMLAKGHGQDELAQKFPVYVAYFTAWPKDDGKVEYFADMYGRDEAVKKAFATIRTQRGAAG